MNELALTEADNGKSHTIPSGARVVLRLRENPTTGYQWHLDSDLPPVLSVTADDYSPTAGGGIGSGGVRVLEFRAGTAGIVKLVLSHKRPWEGQDKALSAFTVSIAVTG